MPEDTILKVHLLDHEITIYETSPIGLGEEKTLSWELIYTVTGQRSAAKKEWPLKTGLQDAVNDVMSILSGRLR